MSHNNLGTYLRDMGKRPEAAEQFRKALDIQERLVTEFPAVPVYRQGLSHIYNNQGILQIQLGQRLEAQEQFRKGLAVYEKMVADFPAVPEYRVHLAGGYCNFGGLVGAGNPSDGLEWFSKAISILTPVYEREPRAVEAKEFLRNSHSNRAIVLTRLQQHAKAIPDWDKAIELSREEEQPVVRAARATSRLQAGQVKEAVAEVAELAKWPFWHGPQWYNFACVYAVASGKLATQKDEYAKRAVELLHQAVKVGYKDAALLKNDPDLDPLRGREDFKKLLAQVEARQVGKLVGPVHEIGQGLTVDGKLDTQTPTLVSQVKLDAGKTYVIDMISPDQNALDPFLVLTDAAGKKLAEDDDSGGGLNARITFRAEQAGTYRIHATSYNEGRGVFILTVREQPLQPKGEKK